MDLMNLQEWKQSRPTSNGTDHTKSFEALCSMLEGTISPSDAARAITKAYKHYAVQTSKNSDTDRLTWFWGVFVCDAIRELGSARERLIELLYEISAQPDVIATDGSMAMFPISAVYWRDLPGFAWELNQHALSYNDALECFPEELDEYLQQAPYILNGCRFAASLFARGFDLKGLDLSVEADPFLEKGIESRFDDKHVVRAQEWKVFLPAAAAWLIIAGEAIYKICLDDKKSRASKIRRQVWDKQKWQYWKEQLQGFEKRKDFDQDCRGFASEALKSMEVVEIASHNRAHPGTY